MTPQEADILRWLDWQSKPVTDTRIYNQFPRLWPGVMANLLQHLFVERDKRHYRITSVGRRGLVAYETQSDYTPFGERPEF